MTFLKEKHEGFVKIIYKKANKWYKNCCPASCVEFITKNINAEFDQIKNYEFRFIINLK